DTFVLALPSFCGCGSGQACLITAPLFTAQGEVAMTEFPETLRKAIENLIDAKLNDALKPGGLDRLRAHRVTGVASIDVRNAERRLDEALTQLPIEEHAMA